MAAFGQLFYCIGNSVGIPYTAKASKLAGMRTAAYNVDVASDRRRRKNVPRHILCSISFGSKSFHLDKAVVYYKQRKQ